MGRREVSEGSMKKWKITFDGEYYYLYRRFGLFFWNYVRGSLTADKRNILNRIEAEKFVEYHD